MTEIEKIEKAITDSNEIRHKLLNMPEFYNGNIVSKLRGCVHELERLIEVYCNYLNELKNDESNGN